MCGLRDIPSQTRLIGYEGLESVEELANRILNWIPWPSAILSSPATTRVLMLKAIKFWVNKKLQEDAPCDLVMESNDAKIAQHIREMSLVKDG